MMRIIFIILITIILTTAITFGLGELRGIATERKLTITTIEPYCFRELTKAGYDKDCIMPCIDGDWKYLTIQELNDLRTHGGYDGSSIEYRKKVHGDT